MPFSLCPGYCGGHRRSLMSGARRPGSVDAPAPSHCHAKALKNRRAMASLTRSYPGGQSHCTSGMQPSAHHSRDTTWPGPQKAPALPRLPEIFRGKLPAVERPRQALTHVRRSSHVTVCTYQGYKWGQPYGDDILEEPCVLRGDTPTLNAAACWQHCLSPLRLSER
jgi:hypothetical protein